MAREKFQIDGKRLKELREESGKTQLTIARELHAKLGINTKPAILLAPVAATIRPPRRTNQQSPSRSLP